MILTNGQKQRFIFFNVPTAEMINIQHDVGVIVAKDL